MENTKIFQKDGKDEYILNGWKMCIHSKRMEKMKIFQKDGKLDGGGGIYIPVLAGNQIWKMERS